MRRKIHKYIYCEFISAIRITISVCSSCQGNVVNNHISNKRRCEHDNCFQEDGGEHLVSQMNGLSLEQVCLFS